MGYKHGMETTTRTRRSPTDGDPGTVASVSTMADGLGENWLGWKTGNRRRFLASRFGLFRRDGLAGLRGSARRRGRAGRERTPLLVGFDHLGDFAPVEHFLFEQPIGHRMEQRQVIGQQLARSLESRIDHATDLAVDLDRGVLGVIAMMRNVAVL